LTFDCSFTSKPLGEAQLKRGQTVLEEQITIGMSGQDAHDKPAKPVVCSLAPATDAGR
jgi:hypothetical protein